MLNKNNLEIAKLIDKTETGSIASLLVEPGRTAVTDGRYAMVVTTPTIPEDFPQIAGIEPQETFDPILIPQDTALKLLKAIPRNKYNPALEGAILQVTDHVVSVGVIDSTAPSGSVKIDIVKLQGKFPNIDGVFWKREDAALTIILDANRLIRLLQAFKPIVNNGDYCPITISLLNDPGAPIRIDGVSLDGQEAKAVLMPVRP